MKAKASKQLARDNLMNSLRTVMGYDEQNILGELAESLTTLSESEMKTVASSMARAALEKSRETSSKKSIG